MFQQVDVEEAVGLRNRRLVHGLKSGLGHQGRQFLQQAVLLQLVAQAPNAEELAVDARGVADEAQFFGCSREC